MKIRLKMDFKLKNEMNFIPIISLLFISSLLINCNKKRPSIPIQNQNKLVVYPNPCSSHCFLSLNNLSGQGYTLTIIGTDGKEIKRIENPMNTTAVDLSSEHNGKYMASLSNGVDTYNEIFYKFK